MITLKRIKRNGDIVTCDAYVEDCQQAIRLTFDMSIKSVEEYQLPMGYEWCFGHIAKAKWHLLGLMKNNKELQTERTIMWY